MLGAMRNAVSPLGFVAIVGSDDAAVSSLQFLLEASGYVAFGYGSVGAFLADAHTGPRCVIVDHQVPHTDGIDLVAKLRSAGHGIPVLLITSGPARDIIARATAVGIAHVLVKPPAGDEIVSFVEALS